jgi:shikimate kinase
MNVSNLKGNIYLLGFMATGKSKVGRILADRLGWSFIDMDAEIESEAGCTITEIFATNGEAYFRELEKQVVNRVTELNACVIALGGGAVIDEENWKKISQTGLTIRLKASPEVILARTMDLEDRPLLRIHDNNVKLERIYVMIKSREPYYARADLHFTSTEEAPPESVATEILTKIMVGN